MQAIIRDDDTSFYTTPALLEAIYERVWARNIPVCFSVIPAHRANIKIPRVDTPYDPNVPPTYRGQDRLLPITENPELIKFLTSLAKQGLAEIMLHGYSHDYQEFKIEDEPLLRRKLNDGMALHKLAFPDIPIRSFIAPYDAISPMALQMVLDMGLDVCIAAYNLKAIPELAHVENYEGRQLPNGRKLFTVGEYFFDWKVDVEEGYQRALKALEHETFVLCNHYWMFNNDWNGQNEKMVGRWNDFLDVFLAQDRTFTTFSDGQTVAL
jgi:hypothetical protein